MWRDRLLLKRFMVTYEEAVQYIEDIPRFAGKNTVDDTRRLLSFMVVDGISSKIVHVAGTNGKGSVCAYLQSILIKSDCSVGMFISPHLETMRERISVNNELISEAEFEVVFEQVKGKVLQAVDKGFSHPSFFEFLFLMAMVYFNGKGLDYIILETGLGGRLDATNCIAKPSVCVITEIGFDHMQYLGNTLEEIAAEKAGIIKPAIPVVFFDKREEVTDILTKYAIKKKSPAIVVGKDNILNVNVDNKTIDFSFHSGYYKYVSLSLNTLALYQVENASLALVAAQELHDDRITPESIRKGLWAAYWPGRMEEILPAVYVDGAHNEDGIEAFLSTVEGNECSGKKLLLFGVVADKSYEKMIQMIADSGLFTKVVVTALETDRSVSSDKLKGIWEQFQDISCDFFDNAEDAFRYLLDNKTPEDIAYVAGSLYLIGQIKSLMRRVQDD